MSELAEKVLQRFLRYVQVDTRSDERSTTFPTTEGQWELLRLLRQELEELGLQEVELDAHGYLFATVPPTVQDPKLPTVGFLAHVDTSPELSGSGVRPLVHRNYRGEPIVLPDAPNAILSPENDPALWEAVGEDLVTASGTTLLGADDKCGVAVILTAAEYLLAHPEIPHGKVRVGFTPDEEVGRGTEHFDLQKFGAHFAYTLDGGRRGELEWETFSADTFEVRFEGFNTHPGYAKGRMVNTIKVAASFLERLPKDRLSPETTEGYEGYVHPHQLEASVERTTVRLLVRDFQTAGLKEKEAWLEGLVTETLSLWPGSRAEWRVLESYRNMREVLERHPEVVEKARQAIRNVGLEVRERPIRGGTDGSRLSFLGLPTPNLFSGQHGIHSRLEWTTAQEMELAVKTILELVRLWAEKAPSFEPGSGSGG